MRRILTGAQTADDYMEVTPQQWASIEADDAAWQAPPQVFVDQWNAACGEYGSYNAATGYFELNGLADISYEQAVTIMEQSTAYGRVMPQGSGAYHSGYGMDCKARTLYPIMLYNSRTHAGCAFMSAKCEALRFVSKASHVTFGWWYCSFRNCTKLRAIYGALRMEQGGAAQITSTGLESCFYNTPLLEELSLAISVSADFSGCPKLSLASFQYMVTNRQGSDAITIKVHPDVWAKLTDADNADWSALMEAAAQKSISFVSA